MRASTLNTLLAVTSVLALVAACSIGSVAIPVERLLAALVGTDSASDVIVVWHIRLPRALAAYLVGASLAASGAALQGLLRNPLAEPGVLGVSACAALGASAVILWGAATSPWAIPIAAVTGALTATALIAAAAVNTRSILTLILVGVGLSSFAGALMSLMLNLAPHPFSLADLISWTLGSVANRSLPDIAFAAPFLLVAAVFLTVARSGLAVLTLGEEAATTAGVNLLRLRLLVIFGAGLATGASVALAGAIGFVGIIAPHLIRPLVHHDPGRSLFPSALLGGLLLVLADIGVRVMPGSVELKLGVVAALLGAPVFVLIVLRRRGV